VRREMISELFWRSPGERKEGNSRRAGVLKYVEVTKGYTGNGVRGE